MLSGNPSTIVLPEESPIACSARSWSRLGLSSIILAAFARLRSAAGHSGGGLFGEQVGWI